MLLNRRNDKVMKYSIIIPTYQHLNDCLRPCLESIMRNTVLDAGMEIIVVANGCTDGTADFVKGLSDSFKLLEFDKPLGYPKSVNEGIRYSTGEHIVLLNNDTTILDYAGVDAWLRQLKEPFLIYPSCGISGPAKVYQEHIDALFCIFFCVMISRRVIDKIGLLDEDFSPGAGEDIDFCDRAMRAGFHLFQVPMGEKTSVSGGVIQTSFPIWHQAEKTVFDIKNWDDIFKRNMKLFIEKRKKRQNV